MSTAIDNKLFPAYYSGYTTQTQIEKIGIAYIQSLIGEDYNEDMIIYKTMKQLQGDELSAWFIEHFIPYITEDKDYNYDGFFLKNIPFREWLKEMKITRNDIHAIFKIDNLLVILRELNINMDTINYEWPIEILIKYWKYHIEEFKFGKYNSESYYSDNLKEYIIFAFCYPGPRL